MEGVEDGSWSRSRRRAEKGKRKIGLEAKERAYLCEAKHEKKQVKKDGEKDEVRA